MIPQQPPRSQQRKPPTTSSRESTSTPGRFLITTPVASSSRTVFSESVTTDQSSSKKRSFSEFRPSRSDQPTTSQESRVAAITTTFSQPSRTRTRITLTEEEKQEVEKIKKLIQQNKHEELTEYHKKFLTGKLSCAVLLESKLAYYIRLVRNLKIQQRESEERKKRKEEHEEFDIVYEFNTEGSIKTPPYAMKHQISCATFAVEKLENEKSFLIAHQMGLGKTLTTLISLYNYNRSNSVVEKGITLSYLVLVPKSNLMHFKEEYDNHFKYQLEGFISNIYVITSAEEEAYIEEYERTGGMIIMTHNRCARLLGDREKQDYAYILEQNTKILIIDEAHVIKNPDSVKYNLFSQINTKRRVLMTGTPFQNNMNEIFTLIRFIEPNNKDIEWIKPYFQEQFVEYVKNKPYEKSSQLRIQLFNHYFRHLIHREVEAQELSEIESKKSDFIIEYKLSKTEKEIYDGIESLKDQFSNSFFAFYFYLRLCLDCASYICDKEASTLTTARLEARLADDEEEDDNEYMSLFNEVKKLVVNKKDELKPTRLKVLRALVEQIIRKDESVIIFTGLICYENDIMAFLRTNTKAKVVSFSGKLDIEQRKQVLKSFKRGEINTLLVSKNSGGVGIDLTHANNVILYQLDFNYYKDDQCLGRLLRKGQTKTVRVFRIVCENSIDQKLLKLQINKQIIFNNLLDNKYTAPSELGDRTIDPSICRQLFRNNHLPISIANYVTRFQHFIPLKSTEKPSPEEFQTHLKEFEDKYKPRQLRNPRHQ
nr:unnamed protein product [Naegleria fowleri]